ncbi:hypothetical protein SAMN06298216_2390 [Spirosomataceae bacterium TFI 002]|nr:hypothetical protein SAMN06298216_2390 [Spirosomataceae bacterium TFI 002]
MTANKITCPNCGHGFDAGEAFQKHMEIELQKKLLEQQKSNAEEIEAFKKNLRAEKDKFEQEEKKKMWAIAQAEAQKRAEEKKSVEIQALKEDNKLKQTMILEAQKKELELMRKENELKLQQEQLKLKLEKDLLERSRGIEEKAKKQKDEEFDLVKKEYEKKLENQMNLVKEMQRKAEQGSMQLQGEVQELAIESLLSQAFPYDEIEEIKKGIRGADAIQTVKNEFGQDCGKLIFESKRTQNFGGDWIEKLKNDQREVGAEIAVLVTQVMPKDMERFGEKDGVWICGFHEVKSLVFVLREILIRTQMAKSVNDNKADKMSLLYTFLTSSQFKQQMEAIVEGFGNLKSELDREKRAMARIWKEREMQIEKVIGNTIDMYGSIKGIAGNSIATIKYLELSDGEDDDA